MGKWKTAVNDVLLAVIGAGAMTAESSAALVKRLIQKGRTVLDRMDGLEEEPKDSANG